MRRILSQDHGAGESENGTLNGTPARRVDFTEARETIEDEGQVEREDMIIAMDSTVEDRGLDALAPGDPRGSNSGSGSS